MSPMVICVEASQFVPRVLDALGAICPAGTFSADAKGVVSWSGPENCDAYCWNRAGCNLLDALTALPAITTLEPGVGAGYYPASNTVVWNPTSTASGQNWCGFRKTRPPIILAHELIHALDDVTNQLDPGQAGEFATVRSENQIRQGMCEPPRIAYGDELVPHYRKGTLDTKNKSNCDCTNLQSEFDRIEHDAICSAQVSLRCLLYEYESRLFASEGPAQLMTSTIYGPEFDEMVGAAPPELRDRIYEALYTRDGSPQARIIDEEPVRELGAGGQGVLLEGVSIDGPYWVVLIRPSGPNMDVTTNLEFTESDTLYVSGPGALVRYTVPAATDFAGILARIPFAPVVEGDTEVHGGPAHFLTTHAGGQTRAQAATYGYRYAATNLSGPGDDEVISDARRAIEQVYQICRELLSGTVEEVRVLAPPA